MRESEAGGSGAVFSPCGEYRYMLRRSLDLLGRGTVVFCMLNPSTANATENDPTVRRCIDYAKQWGAFDLIVVNAYAYRATDPREMRKTDDPVGPANDIWIEGAARSATPGWFICAWGVNIEDERQRKVLPMIRRHTPAMALALTKNGTPRHPLYLRKDLVPFEI